MAPQHSDLLSAMLTWMLVFSLTSVCSGLDSPTLTLKSSVFVAFSGEDLFIHATLTSPANQTEDNLSCYDPLKRRICHIRIYHVGGAPRTEQQALTLSNLSSSGTYVCKFKEVKVYLFVRVRGNPFLTDVESISEPLTSSCGAFQLRLKVNDVCFPAEGYREPVIFDYTEFIIVAVSTGVLLLFSIFGSVYVCIGHWKETTPEGGDMDRKQKQNREDRRKAEIEEGHIDMTTAQSTSFYASLEPRPRSIYEVLDHSAARTESRQKKAKSKRNELSKTVEQDAKHQDEGMVESVYENLGVQ